MDQTLYAGTLGGFSAVKNGLIQARLSGETELADFYQRRAEPDREVGALLEAGATPPQPGEQWHPLLNKLNGRRSLGPAEWRARPCCRLRGASKFSNPGFAATPRTHSYTGFTWPGF